MIDSEASRTSECIYYYGAHLGVYIKYIDCVYSILTTLYHIMHNILFSYWGCGKFFIYITLHYMKVYLILG